MGRDRGNYIGYRGSLNYGPRNQVQPQSFVQGSLGSSKGDINYDAFSDFDNDGIVSTADFAAYNSANPNNASMIETPQAQYSRMMGEGIMGGNMYRQPPMYQPMYQPMYNPSPMPISSRQQFGFGGDSRGKANNGQPVFGMADGGPVTLRELKRLVANDEKYYEVDNEERALDKLRRSIDKNYEVDIVPSELRERLDRDKRLFTEDSDKVRRSIEKQKEFEERLRRSVEQMREHFEKGKDKELRDGGLIKGYQDGGPMLDPMMGMQAMDNPPVSDMDMMSMDSGMMTDAASGADNEMLQIVMEAKSALEGRHPDPVTAIERFVEVFGEEELMSLKEYVIQSISSLVMA